MADFIAPKATGLADHIGAFCVTAGFGTAELAKQYEDNNDDYNAIMIKALADRFAEAFAEYLHREVRVKHWGYAAEENLDNDALIKEKYTGIRPAPGYTFAQDHLRKTPFGNYFKWKNALGLA